jgi:BirA family biotin operon repressor/biotin-[acetyl-CoA-carboxylase] ligase
MTDWTVLSFDELGSTQDKAFEEAERGAKSGTVILTRRQISGRGRAGNVWTGLEGNLFCSILLRPDISLARAGEYSFLAAVALSQALEALLPETSMIQHKWPNDVWVNGNKIAGILLESRSNPEGKVSALVIGVGVNLAAAPEGACSAVSCGGMAIVPQKFLDRFLMALDENIGILRQEGFAAICGKWLARARGIGENIRIRLPRETFFGVFEGISPDGTLRVKLEDGTVREVRSGEVFFQE